MDEILVTLNAINRSLEITIDLARQNLGEDGGAMNMWMHLRAMGVQRARELAPELGILTHPQSQSQSQGHHQGQSQTLGASGNEQPLRSSTSSRHEKDPFTNAEQA